MAIVGLILAIIAVVLELAKTHTDLVIYCLGIGLALVCADVALIWNHGGRYRRHG